MSIPKIILAVLIGAIATFGWNFASWGPLQLHTPAMSEFSDEDAVAEALVANAPDHGVYYLPGMQGMSSESDPVSQAAWNKRYKEGPFVVAFIRPGSSPGMDFQKVMIESLVTQLIGALIIAILLAAAASHLNYIGRVLFVGLIGVFTGVVGIYPGHTWWEFPIAHVRPYMIDAAAGWLLAGVFMAALIKPSNSAPEDTKEVSKEDTKKASKEGTKEAS